MASAELHYATIGELGAQFRRRTLSPVELTEALLARIEKLDPTLRAFVTLTAERARAEARAAEATFQRGGDVGALVGIPVAYKDLYATKGILTTAGSAVLADWVPDADSTCVRPAAERRLRDARQAHHPRVRLRHPVSRPPLPARAQPVEPGAHPRRVEQRIGRGLGRRPVRGLARVRYRGLHSRAGGLLGHRGDQANLWTVQPRRCRHALLDARPHRADGPHRRRLRVSAPGPGRPRPGRSRLQPRARRRLSRVAARGGARPSGRRAARLLLRGRHSRDGARLRGGARRAARAAGPASRTSRSPASTRRCRSWSSSSPRPSPITSATCARSRSSSATCCGRSSSPAACSPPPSTHRRNGCARRSARTWRRPSRGWTYWRPRPPLVRRRPSRPCSTPISPLRGATWRRST